MNRDLERDHRGGSGWPKSPDKGPCHSQTEGPFRLRMGGVKTNAELGLGKAVECRVLSIIQEPTQSLVALAWSSHSASMGSSVLRGTEVRY